MIILLFIWVNMKLMIRVGQLHIIMKIIFNYNREIISLYIFPFSRFCFFPSSFCVSIVYSWVSLCPCGLYCLVKHLSFELWSVSLSVCSFGDWWNDWTLSSSTEPHWFFCLGRICLIISLRNVFLVINGTLVKFPMFWD